jgi:hypothetical protein
MTVCSLPQLKLIDAWSDRWETRWATAEDVGALQALFKDAFNHDMSQARWRWKYEGATAWGTAVEREGRLVGFYGGMPRPCVWKHESLQAVQIGDVMVSPDERFAGRSGPLMRASASYIDNMPMLYPGFSFAFGFPSERPMRLGVTLGLYQKLDEINEIVWSALPRQTTWFRKTRLISPNEFQLARAPFNALWAKMRQDFFDYIVPVRDYDRWLYRYVNHPEMTYQVVLITARFSSSPLAAFVYKEHPDCLELVDFVGGRDDVKLAIDEARRLATQHGKAVVKAWFSSAVSADFELDCLSVGKTGIEVPINLRGKTKAQAVLPAPLFLMAGDTDFR